MKAAPRSDINITPLIDIVLVLLIVFITLVPELLRHEPSVLPSAPAGDPMKLPAPLALILDGEGSISLEGQHLGLDEVGPRVQHLLAERPAEARALAFSVDGRQPLHKAVEVLDRIREGSPDLKVAMRLNAEHG